MHLAPPAHAQQESEARDDEALRAQAARLAEATEAIRERLKAGGKLMLFGNGGSTTDANDWAVDCVTPAAARRTSSRPCRKHASGAC